MCADGTDHTGTSFARLGRVNQIRARTSGGKVQAGGGVWLAQTSHKITPIKDRVGENKPRYCAHHAVEILMCDEGEKIIRQAYPSKNTTLKVEVYQEVNGQPSPVLTVVCRLAGQTPVTDVYPTGECDIDPFMIT